MKKKILILSPHADDEILGCGGIISKYSNMGIDVNVLVLTNANNGAPEIYNSNEIKKIRQEAKLANDYVGTKKLLFENLPGLTLNQYPLYKVANIIKKYINRIKPEVVFIPSLNDIHSDHKIIFHVLIHF